MKLLLTLDFPPETGGIQRYLNDIVMHTYTREDLVLCAPSLDTRLQDDRCYPCRIKRVRFFCSAGNKKSLLVPMLLQTLRIIRRKQPTVIFAGNIYAAMVPWLISLFTPVTYHVFSYGTELLPARPLLLRKLLWKAILNKAEKTYYLSCATLQLLRNGYSCRRCVQWVPRIELPEYDITSKDPTPEEVHLLSVGRLVPHKGHATLVEAVARLAPEEKWRLTIVGNGPEYRRVAGLVRQLSLENKVTICTEASPETLSGLYRQADIFLLPSMATPAGIEGFGIVLLEAMAYGAAIIASRSGGIEEVVEGNSAYAELVTPGSREELCTAMERLITDADRRHRMAEAARKFLKGRYVWN